MTDMTDEDRLRAKSVAAGTGRRSLAARLVDS